MIRSETEYQAALKRLGQDQSFALKQREALEKANLNYEEIERAMEPLISFYAQLSEEVDWYENVRRRNFAPIQRLSEIGRILIALRIANGLSQRELAEKLGISEAVVSRDERNEYHNITVDRAQKILDALNEVVTSTVADVPYRDKQRELVGIV